MLTRLILTAAALALAGCANMSLRSATATATLAPTKGNQVQGTVNFTQKGDKVLVEARVTGLKPGQHGFHVHEKGNCTAPDASSAGAHFNPGAASHGSHASAARHGGDLGNITADSTGTAIYRVEVTGISLGTGPDSVIGKAVIVHANRDDFTTQPSGNSGARIACGLISKEPDKWF